MEQLVEAVKYPEGLSRIVCQQGEMASENTFRRVDDKMGDQLQDGKP